MTNITDFINYELYPSLFERIDIAFTEHNFMRFSGGWRSKTYLNGQPHKYRIDKCVITTQAPYCILEQGGNAKSLINYVMERDNIDFIDAVKKLADICGLKLPNSNFDNKNYLEHSKKQSILELCNAYFIWCLENANSEKCRELNLYLSNRGYSDTAIKQMELGYIPSQFALKTYLLNQNISEDDFYKSIDISGDSRIGESHILTIPFRSGGNIRGFKFRNINNNTPKYLNNKGLEKIKGFFNISGLNGKKDIVIVEGELDALSASVSGFSNVVAIGGSIVNIEQVIDATKRKVESYTLCFDNEPKHKKDTIKHIEKSIDIILTGGNNRIYIAELPDLDGNKTDVDSLLKNKNDDSNDLQNILDNAIPYYEWKLNTILDKYIEIDTNIDLTPKNYDALLEEILEVASSLDGIYLEHFTNIFLANILVKEFGISKDTWLASINKSKQIKIQKEQNKEFQKVLANSTELLQQDKLNEVVKQLESNIRKG